MQCDFCSRDHVRCESYTDSTSSSHPVLYLCDVCKDLSAVLNIRNPGMYPESWIVRDVILAVDKMLDERGLRRQ